MLLVDTVIGEVTKDEELKRGIAQQRPVGKWLREQVFTLPDLYSVNERTTTSTVVEYLSVQTDHRLPMFGYSVEHLNMLIIPIIKNK